MNTALACLLLLMSFAEYEGTVTHSALAEQAQQRIVAALPKRARVAPAEPRRLLVVNRHVRDGKVSAGHPSIPYGNFALQQMGARTGAYEIVRNHRVGELNIIVVGSLPGLSLPGQPLQAEPDPEEFDYNYMRLGPAPWIPHAFERAASRAEGSAGHWMHIHDDEQANRLLSRPLRSPWHL